MQTRGSVLSVAARDRELLIDEIRARLWAALDHAERLELCHGRAHVPSGKLASFLDAHGATFLPPANGQIGVDPSNGKLTVSVVDPVWRALNDDPDVDPSYLLFVGDPAEMTLEMSGGISSLAQHGIARCWEGYWFATDEPYDGWTVAWFGSEYCGPVCRIGGIMLIGESLGSPSFGPDGYPDGRWIDNMTGDAINVDAYEHDRATHFGVLTTGTRIYDAGTNECLGVATPAQWWAGWKASRGDREGVFLLGDDGTPRPDDYGAGRRVYTF